MSQHPTLSLEEFPFQSYDKLRYSDTDRQGHINNANFSRFFETGRVEFLHQPGKKVAPEGRSFVIAQLNIQMIAEIFWPGTVEIGSGVIRIGNSSIAFYQQLFQNEKCVAKAESVIVMVDEETHKPCALPDSAREILQELLLPADFAKPA